MSKTDGSLLHRGRKSNSLLEWISAGCNVALVLIGAVGLCFVMKEVARLAEQNNLVYRTLSQSYRPLAIIENLHPGNGLDSMAVLGYAGKSPETFALGFEPDLRNIGDGLMIYVGYVSLFTPRKIDFLSATLSNNVKGLTFDAISPSYRRMPVLKGEFVPSKIRIHSDDLIYEPQYFIYALFLYEDQDGNLFSTQFRAEVKLSTAAAGNAGEMIPNATNIDVLPEMYHQFSEAEKASLIKCIKSFGHNLADYITPGR